jgi:hypothetical protein
MEVVVIRVRYAVILPNDMRPVTLPPETRAVLVEKYEHLDLDPGGATFEELDPEDVQPLGGLPVGSDVLVESPDPGDVLDLDGATEQAGHIWWLATILAPEEVP